MAHQSSGQEVDNEQQEQLEWEAVNRILQHHGFKPIHFADPMENKNLSDLVLLEKRSASEVRLALKTLLKDTERRQALIQELIQTNNQLKEEAQQQQARAARQSQRASDLERILDGVKTKIQALEDDYIAKAAQHQSQLKQLQQEKRDVQNNYQVLEQKLGEEREVISQLQKKLYFTVKEEERRVTRQSSAFQQICRRTAKPHSQLDQQILDVIDVYEAQIQELRTELRTWRGDADETDQNGTAGSRTKEERNRTIDATLSYKALLKSYQEQLKETKAQKEELREKIQTLKQELESRPTAKELKSCKQQLKRMDRIIQQTNVKSAQLCSAEENGKDKDSTDVEHIDSLQASLCRWYLKGACKELEVQDLNDLIPAAKLRAKQAASVPKLTKVLDALKAVMSNPRAPVLLHRQRPSRLLPPDSPEEVGLELIVPTIDMWANQLMSLKDLHCALRKLLLRVAPWQSAGTQGASETVRVEELLLMADVMLEETAKSEKVLPKSSVGQRPAISSTLFSGPLATEMRSPTRNTLHAMVTHFQQLFDVNSIAGVYPRMNEVYSRLGEMTNAMRNLREILGLDEGAPPSALVNKVGWLCASLSQDTSQQLAGLLGASDIDSIITKLEEHEEFFPEFHSLVLELLHILDVRRLDEIVPAVRSLQMTNE
ncbi:centrosomal protein of 70 kDa isoform X2 [Lepisosteus oculatus]|uniref:centrosomal protein of 70 kDa isoform X2 n=1 Tax=Lepisosteus oculatus TaxID=7918 RepID=UPI0035F52772